jgi:Uma2 family endonuclease
MKPVAELENELDAELEEAKELAEDNSPEAVAQTEEDALAERLASMGVPPPVKVHEYFAREDQKTHVELIFGSIRRMPALCQEYQPLLGRLMRRVAAHVDLNELGQTLIAPIDVVLSVEKCLVVHPHLAVVLNSKRDCVRERIWSAPHIVAEFSWASTSRRLHTIKTRWYRFYGVQELWYIDPRHQRLEVLDMMTNPGVPPRKFRGDTPIQSRMLPKIPLCANDVFAGSEDDDALDAGAPNAKGLLGFV